MSVELLRDYYPPPAGAYPFPDINHHWATIEACIGFRFPSDYKEFCTLYGERHEVAGWIRPSYPLGKGWENAPSDLATYVTVNLASSASFMISHTDAAWEAWIQDVAESLFILRVNIDAAQERGESDYCPYRLWPEKGGLFPWGRGDQGRPFSWLMDGDNPDRWPVVYAEPEWTEFYPTSMTGLLTAMFMQNYGDDEILALPSPQLDATINLNDLW